MIESEKPDALILATGAVPIAPPIPGADQPHVCQAWDALRNRVLTGRQVVVVGGGAAGVETAMLLAENGNAVEEIPADTVVLAIGALPYNPLEELLKQKGILCQVIKET